MAFNAAQQEAFWINGPQMALPALVRIRLQEEGLVVVDDFEDFKEDQLNKAFKNLRSPIPGVPAVVDPAIPVGDPGHIIVPAVPPVPPAIVSARSAQRLLVASVAYHYYRDTARTPTPANMNYTLVLREFYVEWEAMKKIAKEDKPDVPLLSDSKHVTPLKWLESFKNALSRTFGVRDAPLTYLIRTDAAVPPEADAPLLAGHAYSEGAGSIMQELVMRLNHVGSLYNVDNATLYSMIEEATRNTTYAPSVRPFARAKDGRAAYLSLVASHAGNDKWEEVHKSKTKFLVNTKWNGKSYGLDKFTGQHRAAYVALEEASQHVAFQLPNERTRVGYLIDNIVSQDLELKTRVSAVHANTNGMRDNFEATVTWLLPSCPYNRYAKGSGRNQGGGAQANISDVTLQRESKTGVDLRWHTKKEYAQLSKEQKDELYQWQQTKQGKKAKADAKKKNQDKTKPGLKAQVASLKKELAAEKDKTVKIKDTDSQETTYTASEVCAMFEANQSEKRKRDEEDAATAEAKAASLKLQSILKRHKKE